MKIKKKDFFGKKVQHNGFILNSTDAYDSARNIEDIFLTKAKWKLFKGPQPMHYMDIREAYKKYVPDMEKYHPGVIDLITQPEIIRQIGFNVDSDGMVYYPK